LLCVLQTAKYGPLLEAINNGGLPAFAYGGYAAPNASVKIASNAKKPVKAPARAQEKPGDALAKQMAAKRQEIVVQAPISDGQADIIGEKIAEAVAARSSLLRSAGESKTDIGRKVALRVADEWSSFITDASTVPNLLSQYYNNQLTGDDADVDKPKKKKARDTKTKTPEFTFPEELDKINEMFPKLNLSMEEYLAMTGEARAQLFDTMAPLYNQQKVLEKAPAGSGMAFDIARALRDAKALTAPKALDIATSGRSTFGRVGSALKANGVDVPEEQFQTFSPQLVKTIEDYNDKQAKWAEAIKKNPLNDAMIRDLRLKMDRSTTELQANIEDMTRLNSTDFYTRMSVKFDKAGVTVDRSIFNRLKDATIAKIEALADDMAQLQKDIENGVLTGTARIAAQKRIDLDQEAIDKLAVKPEDKAKAAGERFAETARGAFNEGLGNAIKNGKIDPLGMIAKLKDSLIDNFTGDLTDRLLGKDTKAGGFLQNIGANSIGLPNIGMAGGLAANDNQKGGGFLGSVSKLFSGLFGGKKSATAAGEGVANVLTDTAPIVGADISGGILSFAPKIGEDVGKSLSETVGSAAGGGGLSAGGLNGLAAAGGSLAGLLIGKLFNQGGDVSGPGTSTSDSIPARLSNGEFVVKAKQVRKYRPLINAINDDTIPAFAEGGLVGSIGSEPIARSASIKPAQNVTTNHQEISLGITGDVSRQTRKNVFSMLPQIAAGVNAYNREKGIK